MAEMLRNAVGGIGKTKMMYRTMINFDQSKKYTQALLDAELLFWDPSKREFRATEKAKVFIREFDDYQRLRTEADRRARHLDELLRRKDYSGEKQEKLAMVRA